MKDICQFCKKEKETGVIAFYYWRVNMCEKCEAKARKNGHIK